MNRFEFNPLTHQFDLVSNASSTFTAGQDLEEKRIVTLNANAQLIYADHANLTHAGRIIGLTLESVPLGEVTEVHSFGLITNPSWNWNLTQPSVFLSTIGQITQTPPISGFINVVGHVISATQLFISVQSPINLV